MARNYGKWSQRNVPHKGWHCVEVEDLGSPEAVCEMCETQEIRYVHHMKYRDYGEILGVGCDCAGNMELDYNAPRYREGQLRNQAQRRSRWVSRQWRISRRGNPYLNTDGFNIIIFEERDETWGWKLTDQTTRKHKYSGKTFATENEAKLAAFDKMIFLKNYRDWGV